MRIQDMFGSLDRDMCNVCGQTPCNCTHVHESLRTENPCWKGYHPVGTKKKNGKTVPNCVPESIEEGAEFGAYYSEQLAQRVFDANPNLDDENAILNAGYAIAKKEMGSRANGIFRNEDFPSDFVSAYGWLKKNQGVAEGSDVPQWRVEQSDATGRYYVVTGYTSRSRRVWKNKQGAGDFVKRADAEAKAQELNQGVAEGSNDTVYPNAEVIKSKNGKPVGEIYQDGNEWGCFHYRADRGYDMIDSREDAIQALKDLHSETGRSRPDYTIKGVAEGSEDLRAKLDLYNEKAFEAGHRHDDQAWRKYTKLAKQIADQLGLKYKVTGYGLEILEQGVAEGYDTEELADEVYAEFERIYPNLARRANERTVHAAIMDVLNYGGNNDPGALAQDVARAVKQQMQQGVAEGSGNIGRQIKALYQKIYNAGDDAIEFMYYDSPIFAQYWDEYEGDLDSIIAEVDPSELQIIYDELASAAEDQGLAEAGSPAQQAAIAIAMKKAGKKPKSESEGDPEGLPHLTPTLAKHIAQQVKTEGPHAITKSLEWGDGAAKELLDVFVKELDNIAHGQEPENLGEDLEVQRLLRYARAHYPDAKDTQEAFMKYVFHALRHSEEDDMNQNKQIGLLKHQVDTIQKTTPQTVQDDVDLNELNFFKTAPQAPKKFVSRVGTLPGQQDLTYRKNGETFTLHREGEVSQLMSNGQVVQTFDAPERDVQAHLDKQGYFLVKAPMTPTKTSSLGGPNWFKEGEEDEVDYDNEYQNMVKRMAKKAADQEQQHGPVDLADLARKLKALGQKDQD